MRATPRFRSERRRALPSTLVCCAPLRSGRYHAFARGSNDTKQHDGSECDLSIRTDDQADQSMAAESDGGHQTAGSTRKDATEAE